VDRDEKTYSLAAWDIVCQPKKKGGLGLMDLKVQNQGLLLKFLHKFFNKQDIPWVMIVWDKYYQSGAPQAKRPCGSYWWRDVSSLIPIFRGITQCTINFGDTVLRWKDCWADSIPQEAYPHLFSFPLHEDCSVMQYLQNSNTADHFFLPMSAEANVELIQFQNDLLHLERDVSLHDR
jgi:hypothetical protein